MKSGIPHIFAWIILMMLSVSIMPAQDAPADPPAQAEAAPAAETPPAETPPPQTKAEEKAPEEKAAETPVTEETETVGKVFFKPDVVLDEMLTDDEYSIYLMLLSYKRANQRRFEKLQINPALMGTTANYKITGWTMNRLLNQLQDDKLVIVKRGKAGYIYVEPFESATTAPNETIIDYFVPDVSLGAVLPGNLNLSQLLRSIALDKGLKLAVEHFSRPAEPLEFTEYTMNQLLNELVNSGQIDARRLGGFVYIHNPRSSAVENSILYDPGSDTVSFSLTSMRLDHFIHTFMETTGKTVVLPDDLDPETVYLLGHQGMLPLEKGLEAILKTAHLGLIQTDDIYQIKPRIEGVAFEDGFFNIWVQDQPLSEVIQQISDLRPNMVMVLEKLKGTLSMDLKGVSLEYLLDLVLTDTQYSYTLQDNVYLVGGSKMPLLNYREMVKFENVHVAMVYDNMLPEELKKQDGLQITRIDSLNSLLFTGQRALVNEATEVASLMDRPVAQVLLEVIVVEYTLGEDFNLGVKINTPDGGTLFPNISQVFQGFQDEHGNYRISRLPTNFSVILNALENEDQAKTVMRPRVATLSGLPSTLTISETLNYRVTSEIVATDPNSSPVIRTTEEIVTVNADISLEMTPWVIGDDQLTVQIKPTFDTFNGAVVDNVPPGQSKRSLESTVRLRDGETIILGGLITDSHSVAREGIPYLSRIPLVGALFRNKKTAKQLNDMVIYVTPHIYYGGKESPEYLKDKSQLEYKIPSDWELYKKKKKKKRNK